MLASPLFNTHMKKFITHSVLLFLLLGLQNTALAATSYPYSPSEVLENFESAYKPLYDQINTDLHSVNAKAFVWSSTSVLQQFTIIWADGTENGYVFNFIDVNNPVRALDFYPTFENGFQQMEVERTPEMRYGIYRAPMRLRDLIPAMKNDTRLLPTLDSLIAEKCNTSMFVTLRKTLTDRLVWRIEFRAANDGSASAISCNSYLVSVSAEKTTNPFFSIMQLSR